MGDKVWDARGCITAGRAAAHAWVGQRGQPSMQPATSTTHQATTPTRRHAVQQQPDVMPCSPRRPAHPCLSAPAASTNMHPVAWQCSSTRRAERCSAVRLPSREERMRRTGGPSLTRKARAVELAAELSLS